MGPFIKLKHLFSSSVKPSLVQRNETCPFRDIETACVTKTIISHSIASGIIFGSWTKLYHVTFKCLGPISISKGHRCAFWRLIRFVFVEQQCDRMIKLEFFTFLIWTTINVIFIGSLRSFNRLAFRTDFQSPQSVGVPVRNTATSQRPPPMNDKPNAARKLSIELHWMQFHLKSNENIVER